MATTATPEVIAEVQPTSLPTQFVTESPPFSVEIECEQSDGSRLRIAVTGTSSLNDVQSTATNLWQSIQAP